VVEPLAFFAVTTTRSVLATSMERTPYVRAVALTTALHEAPLPSHRCHWYVYESTPPVQVPFEAVSSSPTFAVPVIAGSAVLTGGLADETMLVAAEFAVSFPSVFVPVTTTRSVWSTSAVATSYVLAVALVRSAQFAPALSQRCHW